LVPVFEVRPPAYVLPGVRVDAQRRVLLGRPGREQVTWRVPEGAVVQDRLVTRMPVADAAEAWDAYDIVRLTGLGDVSSVLRIVVTDETVELVNVLVYLRQREAFARR
jgi:predicted nucleotidyltransferase